MGPVGLTTSLTVQARPVTQQGLMVPPTRGGLGPGRQIADRTYYLQDFRVRIQEISAEIEAMNAEMTKREEDKALHAKLEKKYETAAKEVRQLEGDLADINLALDKLRTNTDATDVQDQFQQLKEQNDGERKRIDQVFLQRKEVENAIEELEDKLMRLREADAALVATLGDQAQEQYHQLTERAHTLAREVEEKEGKIVHLTQLLRTLQDSTKAGSYQTHLQGVELIHRKEELLRKIAGINEELSANLTPEELRERLLERVKVQTEEVKMAEQKIKQLEDEADNLKENTRTKQGELADLRVRFPLVFVLDGLDFANDSSQTEILGKV